MSCKKHLCENKRDRKRKKKGTQREHSGTSQLEVYRMERDGTCARELHFKNEECMMGSKVKASEELRNILKKSKYHNYTVGKASCNSAYHNTNLH